MSHQSKLEEVALAQRQNLLTSNTYNGFDVNNGYSATHSRAMSDDETPIHGKGTGVNFDTYNGGSSVDIHGDPSIPGSGRIQNGLKNEYNVNNAYHTPDMSGNLGQVVIA
tara:strand:+ start:3582 stop:3911 length:330 start_codon:yes stop_codon:yes gene_type:complete